MQPTNRLIVDAVSTENMIHACSGNFRFRYGQTIVDRVQNPITKQADIDEHRGCGGGDSAFVDAEGNDAD